MGLHAPKADKQGYSGDLPGLEDHPVSSLGDGQPHRQLNCTVDVNNLLVTTLCVARIIEVQIRQELTTWTP